MKTCDFTKIIPLFWLGLALFLVLTQEGHCAGNQTNAVLFPAQGRAPTARVITPDQQKQFDTLFNQSINFWGKVVDEDGVPVSGALVKYWIEDETTDPEHLPEHTTTTDGQGLFSILGQKGPSLGIQVSKAGYYSVASDNSEGALGSNGSFTYAARGLHDRSLPEATNPVAFLIQKKGKPADHLVLSNKNSAVPINGASVLIYLDPADKTATSHGDLQISASTEAPVSTPDQPNQSPFTWSATITVVGGGLIPFSHRLAFEAPETGYESSDHIGFQKDDPHWDSSEEKFYFIKLGNNHFSRVDLVFYAKRSFVTIHCYYNQIPGDRNLEYKTNADTLQ